MNFGSALWEEGNWTETENGQAALKSTESGLLDFYAELGTLRNKSENEKTALFAEAYKENPLNAMKIMFYGRDIREGLGERKTFREILKYAATFHPEAVVNNIPLIGLYGRYDDLYSLIGTPVEADMWAYMKEQFATDLVHMYAGMSVSLLAKWIKTPDSAHESTRKLGRLTAVRIGYRNRLGTFKRELKDLRKYIGVVEPFICNKQYDWIDYSVLPGKAFLKYKGLFEKYDAERFARFNQSVMKGEAEVKSSAIVPYDIVHQYVDGKELDLARQQSSATLKYNEALEAAWKSLQDYVTKDFLVVCDTSGSMYTHGGNPIYVALSLAIYSAEHNKGQFKDTFITFSSRPEIQILKGETLADKIVNLSKAHWDSNTDIWKAMELVLDIAVKNKISQEEMPGALVVVSDMQFDAVDYHSNRSTTTDILKEKFRGAGYELPNIIYWNVGQSATSFHAKKNDKGVQLVSGCSPSILKGVLDAVDMTAYEAMMKVINSERYEAVTI